MMSLTGLEITQATISEKPILTRLLELYSFELSPYTRDEPDAEGLYGYEYLDNYWEEPDRFPYLVRVDARLAGFALVCGYTPYARTSSATSIAEFFIMPSFRHQGFGSEVAREVIGKHPGEWEVRVMEANRPAYLFWRRMLQTLEVEVVENWVDDSEWKGAVFSFVTGPSLPSDLAE